MQKKDQRKECVAGVIVAAGLSSRMGRFKPLLPIGNTTFVKRIIHTMRKAGVDEIVVVGGAHFSELSDHLLSENVRLLCNEAYESTQMFASFQIALGATEHADAILFTPVDIVLPDVEVYRGLLASDVSFDCVRPSYEGKSGHPVLIRKRLFPALLSYSGDGGLKAALQGAGAVNAWANVQEPGILMDADTPEDYRRILSYDAKDQLSEPSGRY